MQTHVKRLEALSRLLSASRTRSQPGAEKSRLAAPAAYLLLVACTDRRLPLPVKNSQARAPVADRLLSGCHFVVSLSRFTAPVAL